jgi:partitioning defective protein 3
MSEKRHATLDAKSTDTYKRNKKVREEREKQRIQENRRKLEMIKMEKMEKMLLYCVQLDLKSAI